ncbi:MAG: CBS domain-containing protein [Desulfohalobiaceae bacterium]|nr:CBS domain-containing protein [Desulfohalobiaceae bacterium]
MKEIFVRDLMVPLEEYATVPEEATLHEAVLTLERAQKEYLEVRKKSIYPHRAILVLDTQNKVIGKVSQVDVIKGLEPKYQELISSNNMATMATSGFSADFLRGMLQPHGLFAKPLQALCQKAARVKVKDLMYTPDQGEYVKAEDSLEIAVNQFIIGRHHSLLVTGQDDEIVGILRLVDVFSEIAQEIKSCEL